VSVVVYKPDKNTIQYAEYANVSATANENILSSNLTFGSTGRVIVQVVAQASGTLSVIIDGISGTAYNGQSLTAGAWIEFEFYVRPGSTVNFQYSESTTISIIIIFIEVQ